LSRVRLGQLINIDLKATLSDRSAMNDDGLFCTLTRSGNVCRAYGSRALTYVVTRVSTNMIVRGKVTFSAVYRNPATKQRQTVATKRLQVVPRKT
jgi:hypothetical protein